MTATVLVLDNDPHVRQLLTLALERGGMRVLCCRSGEEARRTLCDRAVDFMILDLNLGGGDSGELLAAEWTAAGCAPPFFMLTGMPDDPRVGALEGLSPFRGVIAKPFSVVALVDRVRGALPAGSSVGGGA